MTSEESAAILQEIRDLQREHLAVARQALANQVQAIANQTQAIQQQQANSARSRSGMRKLGWAILILIVITFLVPYANLWLRHMQ